MVKLQGLDKKKIRLESLFGYSPSLFLYPILSVQLNITSSGKERDLKKIVVNQNDV